MNEKLWQPATERVRDANITLFAQEMADQYALPITDAVANPAQAYEELHHWSVDNKEAFWSALWDYSGVVASHKGETVLLNGDKMPGATWFPDAKYCDCISWRR